MVHSSSRPLIPDCTLAQLEQIEDISNLVCHELRTPLTSIQGVLKILHNEQFANFSEDGERLLGIAISAANRLTRLANAIEHRSEAIPSMLSLEDMKRLKLGNDLVCALSRQEFFLDYQPIISITDDRVIGFEALARWNHPDQGVISPTVFIPLAEKSGLIQPLGLSLLEQACQQLWIWQREFPSDPPISMSINLSSVQLSQSDLSQKIQEILLRTGVTPETLKLEITESALMENQDRALDNILNLKEIGVKVHLDDFGTGYSSLARLQDFPFDALKIDKSFILSQNWIVSEAILLLASRLQLDVVAEGIETLEQLQSLRKIGCDKVQGYYFSRPVNNRSASQLLARKTEDYRVHVSSSSP
ncbi:MAG: EAL domain-containing protein [Leptolyngbya sp. SIO1E4]|nr:EAL domain-containing protein [Leptolyngbya sp. SIO1E4]